MTTKKQFPTFLVKRTTYEGSIINSLKDSWERHSSLVRALVRNLEAWGLNPDFGGERHHFILLELDHVIAIFGMFSLSLV